MKHFFSALKLTLAASVLYASAGCVSSRDVRNGVFDENQYLRKSMLVNPETDATDPPWILQGTVEQVSSPNPLSSLNFYIGVSASHAFKWRVTSDKLQMVSVRNLTAKADSARTDALLNSWPVSNVDLKLRVNLDGETTNFYEENQEQPWARRQFVKLTLAKNDLSDVAVLDGDTEGLLFTTDSISKCIDAGNSTTTLVPGSFVVDEASSYISWKVQLTMPFVPTDPVCGALLTNEYLLGTTNITSTIMYSMTRLKPVDETATYKPVEVAEKDPIRRKYGIIQYTSAAYAPFESTPDATGDDPNLLGNSGLLSARQLLRRHDMTKDLTYYMDPQLPDRYKAVLTGPNGIAEQTNAIFEKVGVKGRLFFKEANDGLPDGQVREYGDVRYNYIRYVTDPGIAEGLLGLEQSAVDPRTGEDLKEGVNIYNQGYLQNVAFQYDFLLKTIGAGEGLASQDDNGNAIDNPWKALPEPCKNGDHLTADDPRIVTAGYLKAHHNQSTLFNKLQQYLNKPATTYGNLNPGDFVQGPDPKYRDIYFDLLPFFVYTDPAANPFVTPEGGTNVFGPSTSQLWDMRTQEVEFQKILGQIDRGFTPYDATDGVTGIANATAFSNKLRNLTQNHRALTMALRTLYGRYQEMATPYPLMEAYAQGSRRCVDHKWETRTQFVNRFVDAQVSKTIWHEFGHSLGLDHNFMGSVDERNWPRYTDEAGEHYAMNSSSVMDYTDYFAESTFGPGSGFGWGPYDAAAIAWTYGNDAKNGDSSFALGTLSVSGQKSATAPWNDPLGFRADGSEITYLFCDAGNISVTPLCQQFDWGASPNQITAHDIDQYDWQYQFRNQRAYYKYRSFSSYGSRIASFLGDSRRFIPFAADVQGIGDIIRKLKIPAPQGIPQATFIDSVGTQLIDSVTAGSTQAAALHKAIIEQASAERPFSTSVDQRFGDVNVQGIIIDKVFAAQGWLGLAPVTNQDPNVTGRYSAPYTEFVSSFYITVAADTLDTVLGGGYDTYPWLIQSNIALFAQDSHSQNFNINFAQYREWIGLQPFTREADFLAYFQAKAEAANFNAVDPVTGVTIDCRDAALDCKFDIRNFSDRLQTITLPDGHNWTWMYIKDRNAWMAAERDRNPVTYRRIRDYTSLLATGADDDNLYNLERPLKFYYDAFSLNR